MLCVWGVALDPKKVHKNIKKIIYLLVIYSIYKLLSSFEVDLELLCYGVPHSTQRCGTGTRCSILLCQDSLYTHESGYKKSTYSSSKPSKRRTTSVQWTNYISLNALPIENNALKSLRSGLACTKKSLTVGH